MTKTLGYLVLIGLLVLSCPPPASAGLRHVLAKPVHAVVHVAKKAGTVGLYILGGVAAIVFCAQGACN